MTSYLDNLSSKGRADLEADCLDLGRAVAALNSTKEPANGR